MNKAELLADLLGRDNVDWVSDPEDVTASISGPIPDHMKRLRVYIMDQSSTETELSRRPIYAWVIHDGGTTGTEKAWYDTRDPGRDTFTSAFIKWMREQYLASYSSFAGLQILWVSEDAEACIFSHLVDDAGDLKFVVKHVIKGEAPKLITNWSPEFMEGNATRNLGVT